MITLKAETIPFYLDKLESMVKENNGFFALSKLTWADLYFVALLNYLNHMATFNLVADRPALSGLVESVNGLESIKVWLTKRPSTTF